MQLIYVIMKQLNLTDELMVELANAGVKGATILDSEGMAKYLYKAENVQTLDFLKQILNKENANASKTILMAVNDDMVDTVRNTVKGVLGNFDTPNAGVMFGVPISFADGI
ncbi:MAG: hypothetical protein E7509_07280 [Ruminococcus sp.]|nr:hypothetical protein [Ruminococcus sp.]